jgi:uncharacterized protein YndB with AHSA1/START domain
VNFKSKSQLPASFSRRRFIVGGAIAVAGLPVVASGGWADTTDEISRSAESIHQERNFAASRRRVYDALTVTTQFDQVIRLSEATRSGMKLGTSRTALHADPGGTFTLFGGHIFGRFIELVPNERIVQAWRVANWDPGAYSIASYRLSDEGSGTKLVFDHAGFPSKEAEHLAHGWDSNYWEPLAQYLKRGENAHP